jgi:thiamine biosynthesis protein ThiS
MSDAIQIMVNGQAREAAPGTTVVRLLEQMGLEPGRVAIERNLEILPRACWPETRLERGDRFEIVQFVGGG